MGFDEVYRIVKDEMAKLLNVTVDQVPNDPWWDYMSTFAELNASDTEITEDDLRRDFRELVEDLL